VQASHIFSRNKLSVRWDIDNGITLCHYCHIYWAHRNPVEFVEWIREKIGEERYLRLKEKAYSIGDVDVEKVEEKLKEMIKRYEKLGRDPFA